MLQSPTTSLPDLREQIRSALIERLPDSSIELICVDQCESTNQLCAGLARHGAVVVAEQQTAGRGRRGNRWHSSESGNIYCSMGIEKRLPGASLGLLSLTVGVSIARVLHAEGVSAVRLKWPNDILLQGAKLGGILIENRMLSPDNFFLVIGFGLNLQLEPVTLQAIDQPAIALNHVLPEPVDRQQLLAKLIAEIFRNLNAFQPEDAQSLIEEFSELDHFHGQAVRIRVDADEIEGHYLGIEEDGQLLVRTTKGEQRFAAAEISLRGRVPDAVDR